MSETGHFNPTDHAARFHGKEFARQPDGSLRTIPTFDNEAQGRAVAEHVNRLHVELMAEVPHHPEGIDTASIDTFFHQLGLPRRDYLLMDQLSTTKYNEIVQKYGYGAYPPIVFNDDGSMSVTYGTHHPATDLAIVRRDPTAEARYGTIFTEAHLVHELAHASSDWNEWTITRDEQGHRYLRTKRVGQAIVQPDSSGTIRQHHSFIEEGFASKIMADYLKFKGVQLNYKNNADLAGEGIQALIDFRPELFPALIQARSQVEGLQRVAQIINSIEPGLYDRLEHLEYSSSGFGSGRDMIQQIIQKHQATT